MPGKVFADHLDEFARRQPDLSPEVADVTPPIQAPLLAALSGSDFQRILLKAAAIILQQCLKMHSMVPPTNSGTPRSGDLRHLR